MWGARCQAHSCGENRVRGRLARAQLANGKRVECRRSTRSSDPPSGKAPWGLAMSGRSREGSSGVPVGGGGPKPVGLGIPEVSHCSHSVMPVAGQEASGNARESSGNAGWLPATPGAFRQRACCSRQYSSPAPWLVLGCLGLQPRYGPPGGWAARRWGKLGFRLSATKPGFPPPGGPTRSWART